MSDRRISKGLTLAQLAKHLSFVTATAATTTTTRNIVTVSFLFLVSNVYLR